MVNQSFGALVLTGCPLFDAGKAAIPSVPGHQGMGVYSYRAAEPLAKLQNQKAKRIEARVPAGGRYSATSLMLPFDSKSGTLGSTDLDPGTNAYKSLLRRKFRC